MAISDEIKRLEASADHHEQAVRVARNESNHGAAEEHAAVLAGIRARIDELRPLAEEPHARGGMVPCEGCGKPVWPDSSTCDGCLAEAKAAATTKGRK